MLREDLLLPGLEEPTVSWRPKGNRILFFPYREHKYQQEAEKSHMYVNKSMN